MKFELVKIDQLSGKKAGIYTILMDGETLTLFEKFLHENQDSFKSEMTDI